MPQKPPDTLPADFFDGQAAKAPPAPDTLPADFFEQQAAPPAAIASPPAKYETQLTPAEQPGFDAWKAKNAPNDSGEDYDLRGLFKSGQGTDARGHATDQFKKPNHPTFSTQSQYSGKDGNTGGQWIERDGKTFFTPSQTNLKTRSFAELQQYFKENEPDATLVQFTGPLADPKNPASALPSAAEAQQLGERDAQQYIAQLTGRPAQAPVPSGLQQPATVPTPRPIQVGSPKLQLPAEPRGLINPQITQPAGNVVKPAKPGYTQGIEALQSGNFKEAHEILSQPPEFISQPVDELNKFLVGPFQFHAAVTKAAAGLTSPENLAIGGATAGLGAAATSGIPLIRAAAQTLNAGLSTWFASQAGKSMGERSPELVKAVKAGDLSGIAENLGFMSADAMLIYFAGQHATEAAGEAHGAAQQVGDLFREGGKYGKAQPTRGEVVPDYSKLSDDQLVGEYSKAHAAGQATAKSDIAREIMMRQAMRKPRQIEPGRQPDAVYEDSEDSPPPAGASAEPPPDTLPPDFFDAEKPGTEPLATAPETPGGAPTKRLVAPEGEAPAKPPLPKMNDAMQAAHDEATAMVRAAEEDGDPFRVDAAKRHVAFIEELVRASAYKSPPPKHTPENLADQYAASGMQPSPNVVATPEEIRAGAELAIENHNAENPAPAVEEKPVVESAPVASADHSQADEEAAGAEGAVDVAERSGAVDAGSGAEEAGRVAPVKPNVAAAEGERAGTANLARLEPGAPGIAIEKDAAMPASRLRKIVYRDEQGRPRGYLQFYLDDAQQRVAPKSHGLYPEVYVSTESRRSGIATKLYDAARKAGFDLSQVSGTEVTPAGAAFLNARKAPKPGTIMQLPASAIARDPVRFQFKGNTGERGVGEKLRGVQKWDPEKGGTVAVWHDPAMGPDSKPFVVNGHQRLGLLDRVGGPADTATVRFIKADTAREAMVKGALINIAEDSGDGDPIDAAKVFRDSGFTAERLAEEGISLTGKMASQGLALAKLDPHLFGMVVSGDIPPARAAVIGAGLPEHADQRALYDVIQKRDKAGKRLTNDQIGEMIRLALGGPKKTGVRSDEQGVLFGAEEVTRSLIAEKAEVSDYIRKQLAGEKRLFSSVGDEAVAGKLSERGNVIKAGENKAVADQAAQALAIYDKLSERSGPVSDALGRAAAELAEGNDATKTKQAAYLRVRQALAEELRPGKPGLRRAEGLGSEGPREAGQGQHDPADSQSPVAAGDSLPFGDSFDPDAQRAAEDLARRRLEGDQLSAEFNSPTRGKVKPAEPPPQTDLFEETPEHRAGDLFSDERGAVSLNTATLGLQKFYQQDIRPGLLAAAKLMVDAKDEILQALAPGARGPRAAATHAELRYTAAELQRRADRARTALEAASKALRKLPLAERWKFVDRIEHGQAQPTIELQAIGDLMRAMLDDARDEVQSLGTGKLQSFYANYFPHIWADPKKAAVTIASMLARRPLEGKKSFLKKRTIVTVADGLAAGLTPVSEDPVEMILAKLGEMQRYIMAQHALAAEKKAGRMKYVDARKGKAPKGWQKIDDAVATVYGPSIQQITEYPNEGLWNGLHQVAAALGIQHKRGFENLRNAVGRAHPAGWVKTLHGSAEQVLAHEIGHQIDWRAGSGQRFITNYPDAGTVARLKRAYATLKDPASTPADKKAARAELKSLRPAIAKRKEFARQLRALADLRGGRPEYTHKREEKMAQLAEMWVGAREQFKRTAPTVFEEWRQFLDDNPKLHALRDIEGTTGLTSDSQPYDVGGLVIRGHWWAPEESARLFNNYLSPGLRAKSPTFRAYMGAGNVLLQFQLGWSAFHATFVSLEAMTSRFALGVYQANHGAVGKGLQSMAIGLTPASPFQNYRAGKKIQKAWDRPGSQTPLIEQMTDAVVEAGGRARMDRAFQTHMTNRMMEAFRAGNILGGILRSPFAATEQVARPVMEFLVPRMKLGAFAKMAEFEMERLGPGATPLEIRQALGKAWDSIDNRFGQLVYDNLAWNRVHKELAMGSFRTVGWNVGDIRELGGGALDALKSLKGAPRARRFEISHRLSYLLALPLVIGLYGAITNYLLTGEAPEDLKTMYYPHDGEGGRVSMPSYIKEVMSLWHDPTGWAKGKVHPLFTLILDMLSNRDYFNRPIAKPDDPLMEQLLELAKYPLSVSTPISVQGLQRSEQGTLKEKVLPFVGFPRAPKYITSDGEGVSGSDAEVDRLLGR